MANTSAIAVVLVAVMMATTAGAAVIVASSEDTVQVYVVGNSLRSTDNIRAALVELGAKNLVEYEDKTYGNGYSCDLPKSVTIKALGEKLEDKYPDRVAWWTDGTSEWAKNSETEGNVFNGILVDIYDD